MSDKKWRKLDEVRAEREAIAAKARQRIEGTGMYEVTDYEVHPTLGLGLKPLCVYYKNRKGKWVRLDTKQKETK